jgi:hypothetical protein
MAGSGFAVSRFGITPLLPSQLLFLGFGLGHRDFENAILQHRAHLWINFY